MDPYKVLGVSESRLKHPSDLDAVRKRAKTLFKRFSGEKKKFDAKKVLEAFDMIKKKLKGRPGEGQYKLIGRSRKERELDKHFNHQTKEIKKNKEVKRTLRRAARGEKRLHLPGDKERIPRHRRHRKRRKVVGPVQSKMHVDILQGLNRLAAVLPQKAKFPKVIKLLYRWLKEYMTMDNQKEVFEVLRSIVTLDFLTEDPDARQDVALVFEYVLGYFSEWFDQAEPHRMLGQSWLIGTVLACRCYTDDAFMLSTTITKLNGVLSELEKHKDTLEQTDAVKQEDGVKEEDKLKLEEECGKVKLEDSMTLEMSPSPLNSPFPMSPFPSCLHSPGSDDEDEVKKDSHAPSKDEVKEEVKQEVKEELIGLDSDSDDDEVKEELISSDESDVKVEEISDSGSEDESSSDVEECSGYIVPNIAKTLTQTRALFVHRCLGTLFQQRNPMWARPKIDAFFQDVFYRRSIFAQEQQTQVEAWQARIKTLQKLGENKVGEANNPLEAQRPVIDSREMRTTFDSDSNAWAAKQTFDSRDTNGARGVIR